MKIKRILLTGDDGYNSVGTRLLIRALKDTYQLQVAATKTQQSGMGGKLSLQSGGNWGETEIDGVPVFWTDGSPADVMECSQAFFNEPFDLIISGVNWGSNASSAVISSGTYSAAIRGLGVNLAPKAMAISWDAPPELWHQTHADDDDISVFFEYPGSILRSLIENCLENELWGVAMLNINLPKYHTNQVRFTKILKDITKYYAYPITVDRDNHTFSYQREPFNIQVDNLRYDVAALDQGFISITPCAFDMTHFESFEKLEKTKLVLSNT